MQQKYICIHGHFYQPPRENPWLEEVELQDSAYPYHDWNQRISAECYAPNTTARILDADKNIIDIMNNYKNISFNFGPTLLSWMKKHDPDTYESIQHADAESRMLHNGHGSALAQCYNHMIMPLANRRDKITQIRWGIVDFRSHFQRQPEGMWLPETAVDYETLEILQQSGIKFTLLAPRQAQRIRKVGTKEWHDVSEGRIDPCRPYLCRLPSGASIVLFFYDGPISQGIAFEHLLYSGEKLANRLKGVFHNGEEPQLVHIATDGETYGHHHAHGEMALAFALDHIEKSQKAKITIYADYLEQFPPEYEVEIYERSSWSCVHGVERWRADCGCNSGMNQDWHQKWRATLRSALDWLRDNLCYIYEQHMLEWTKAGWDVRDDYIDVILDRRPDVVDRLAQKHGIVFKDHPARVRFLRLLEMQRHAMLMYTSCGWFFDEISGIETVQIIQYAARAIQLAKEVSGIDLEPTFIKLLQRAPSNISRFENGANIYNELIKVSVMDMTRVAAHYAVSSLFEEQASSSQLYSYHVRRDVYERLVSGKVKMALGRVEINSVVTDELLQVSFAVLHLGDHNLTGGVSPTMTPGDFDNTLNLLRERFKMNDIPGIIRMIEDHFPEQRFSLWHLFRDEQTKILYQILDSTVTEVESSLRKINEHHYPIIQVIKSLKIPLPKILANTVAVMLNTDLLHCLGADEIQFDRLEHLVLEVSEWSLEIDKKILSYVVQGRIHVMMEDFAQNPDHIDGLRIILRLIKIIQPLGLNIDLWRAENIYFSVGRNLLPAKKALADQGHDAAKEWLTVLTELGEMLKVKVLG